MTHPMDHLVRPIGIVVLEIAKPTIVPRHQKAIIPANDVTIVCIHGREPHPKTVRNDVNAPVTTIASLESTVPKVLMTKDMTSACLVKIVIQI